jgi:hypothetical protein
MYYDGKPVCFTIIYVITNFSDPDWIWIQLGQRVRIRIRSAPDPELGKPKLSPPPKKREKIRNFMFEKQRPLEFTRRQMCWVLIQKFSNCKFLKTFAIKKSWSGSGSGSGLDPNSAKYLNPDPDSLIMDPTCTLVIITHLCENCLNPVHTDDDLLFVSLPVSAAPFLYM